MQDHKYLDKNRIGVWGWGYGGYITTSLMNSQYRLFKCGIAVSPIADWSYYSMCFDYYENKTVVFYKLSIYNYFDSFKT